MCIENELRNTMGQERLNNITWISIECDLLRDLDITSGSLNLRTLNREKIVFAIVCLLYILNQTNGILLILTDYRTRVGLIPPLYGGDAGISNRPVIKLYD